MFKIIVVSVRQHLTNLSLTRPIKIYLEAFYPATEVFLTVESMTLLQVCMIRHEATRVALNPDLVRQEKCVFSNVKTEELRLVDLNYRIASTADVPQITELMRLSILNNGSGHDLN